MDDLSLGERVALVRRRRHMTQTALAAVINVAPSEIYRLEAGIVQDPHWHRMIAIAQALQISLDWLAGLTMD